MSGIPIKDILNSKINAPREEASSKDFANILKPTAAPSMTVHIEISRTVTDGEITITADINNQADLDGFMLKCKGYMPRKKWFGIF
jgi:hypothetical protein